MKPLKKQTYPKIFAAAALFSMLLNVCATNASDVPGPVVKVENVKGVPTFTVAGEPYTSPCFETYHPKQKYFDQFAAVGTKLFSFNTAAAACDYGHSEPTMLGVDYYDYTHLEERVARVLAAKPDALIILRINLGTPLWWIAKNPDELEVLDTGLTFYKGNYRTHFTRKQFPSVVSEKWRSDTGIALKKFIEYVQTSKFADHIYGYFLAGLHTEEWYHWSAGYDELSGYSAHMERAFRKWLKDKYIDNAVLRQAWNRIDVDFNNVKVPSRQERYDRAQNTFRNPAEKMNVIDFYLFYNDLIPDTIDYFARIVREATQGTKIIGAFSGYMYTFWGNPEYGQNANSKFNQSKNLDFTFSTPSYEDRTFGAGGDLLTAPNYSMRLHGKLWYHDNDLASFLCEKIISGPNPAIYAFSKEEIPYHLRVFGATNTPQESQWMYRRSMGFAICNGAYESFFDLLGGSYEHPELMAEVERLIPVAEASAVQDRSSNSEILVIADEASCSYASFFSRLLYYSLLKTQTQLIKVGAHADQIFLSDLELLNTDPYKLVVFLNCYNITDAQRATIRKKLMKDGKYLLWSYSPGYFNGNKMNPDFMQELTGIRIVPSPDPIFIEPRIELKTADSKLSQLIDENAGSVIGPEEKICRLMSVHDKEAVTLGILPGTDEVILAMKVMGEWTSLYSITPCLPAEAYRELARSAGVHIYNEKNDTFYNNSSYLCIHANGEGKRTIKMPYNCDVVDVITKKSVVENNNSLTYDFQNGETLLLNYKKSK